MENNSSDDENDFVFDDNDGLTWSHVSRAIRVHEPSYLTRISMVMKESFRPNRINLEKRLKNKEDELNVCKSNFEVLQTQMDIMRSALLAIGIQVPKVILWL
ncbi:hypothetical protein GQ457_07G014030 [Hibiscus cannabinus]